MSLLIPHLDESNPTPLYIQLYQYVKHEIINGRLSPGYRLPSKRKWSRHLQVSLNTVDNAYQQLIAEGLVESKPRKGLFVVSLETDLLSSDFETPKPAPTWTQPVFSQQIDINFHQGNPDLKHFPFQQWRKYFSQVCMSDALIHHYPEDPQGEWELREEIAHYLYASRGVSASPDQIILGAGTLPLISLLCRIIGTEHAFAMEDPGFTRARATLQSHGVSVQPIPLDQEGIQFTALQKSRAKAVYVTPSHQFPLGTIMSFSRRMQLLKWARDNHAFIVEDDYDSEFRYHGRPIPSLQGLDHWERVIYIGTFSKSLLPGIRIGYMVLPPVLLERYRNHFSWEKQTASPLHQQTLQRFMKEGEWERHLHRMRTLYRKKHQVLIKEIERQLGEAVQIIGARTGLHILLRVHQRWEETELVQRSQKEGVAVYPISVYYTCPDKALPSTVMLGFGGLTLHQIREGIGRLAKAWLSSTSIE